VIQGGRFRRPLRAAAADHRPPADLRDRRGTACQRRRHRPAGGGRGQAPSGRL